MVALADFSGHGVYSALNTVRLDLLIAQADIEILKSPKKAIKYLNKLLYKALPSDEFCTLIYIVMNTKTGKCEYVASNSPNLYILKADKTAPVALSAKGFPLGLTGKLEDTDFTCATFELAEGDSVISYSDALVEEEHSDGSRWLDEGLINVLAQAQTQFLDSKDKFDYVVDTFNKTAEKPLTDDLTIVSLARGK